MKSRLDVLILQRGLAESRERAQALIMSGKVRVDGQKSDKPGRLIAEDARVEVESGLKYVSRGGLKLEASLSHFDIDPAGKVCLDIGTSTGGFTDCLLQHGAARVHCVDTGAGQIDWKLRGDHRVVLHERLNARYLEAKNIGEAVDLVVCDVSFISVTLILPAVIEVAGAAKDWIILVKPQFEVGREKVGKGGIVRDEGARQEALNKVASAMQSHGFTTEAIDCPVPGSEGNVEFLLHARPKLSS